MEDRDGFIKESKAAVKGAINGIFGSIVYEVIIMLAVSFFLTAIISGRNPNSSPEQLEILVNDAYNSFPYGILISCLASLATLIVFAFIVKFDTFKQLCKKALNLKTIKYGIITGLCLIGFSLIYNYFAVLIFDLNSAGNANQDAVTTLIKSNAILGFLSVVVLAPIVEELTYRYCIFGGLRKYKKIIAYIVSGVIFMIMHSIASISETGGINMSFVKELVYLPPYLFSGLALCYAYDKTGNIGSSVVAHFFNNLISFLVVVCL